MKYESVPELSREEIEAILSRNRPEELLIAVLAASLFSDDPAWAESLCISLATHPHPNVRGNAILGLGHIARLHGALTDPRSRAIVDAALADPDEFVRGQADSAHDDLHHFLRPAHEQRGA